MMRLATLMFLGLAGVLAGCAASKPHAARCDPDSEPGVFYLPNPESARIVSITNAGPSAMSFVVQTLRSAVKETGPKETLARFGEVYSISPTFLAVHRDEPTQLRFWNLQPDDVHSFMLVDPRMNVLMNIQLPPVEETAYIFTFHEEGLFNFFCSLHQPAMHG